ncbi:hypothetical protein B194_0978 [Serratia plymuthica A30]|nr:hypothetical protein B194_0978 [Serratia plymuthica A30]
MIHRCSIKFLMVVVIMAVIELTTMAEQIVQGKLPLQGPEL